mmetsp:Transcript_54156/g.115071  ORF Transcript_54156/g.115071 Transcript_54156/m.115071 type:complete len:293 (+) Transcript_54156:516-1394(+)
MHFLVVVVVGRFSPEPNFNPPQFHRHDVETTKGGRQRTGLKSITPEEYRSLVVQTAIAIAGRCCPTKESVSHIDSICFITWNFLPDEAQYRWEYVKGRYHRIRLFTEWHVSILPTNDGRHAHVGLPRRSQSGVLAAVHAFHLEVRIGIDASTGPAGKRRVDVFRRTRRASLVDVFLQPPPLELSLGARTAPLGRPRAVVARENHQRVVLYAGVAQRVEDAAQYPIHLLHGVAEVGGESARSPAEVFRRPLALVDARRAQLMDVRKRHVEEERSRARGVFADEVRCRIDISRA